MNTLNSAILAARPLGFLWETEDPFLFCAHHDDHYPRGNQDLGPAASLAGRNIGQDFERKDGWSMYHGHQVPGFPAHPHRGFETVTLVRTGLIDHSDSLGATARFGGGDVQWLTAGRGIVHSEMFPLLAREQNNPLELFQIWLNLPARDKMVAPHFTMFWAEQIPRRQFIDEQGRVSEVVCVAGRLGDTIVLPPPPDSWAARAESDLAIWTLKLAPGAQWTMPAARKGTRRNLYWFKGAGLVVDGQVLAGHVRLQVRADCELLIQNSGADDAELLLLQGAPIAEPVTQYGPFVMNTREQIQQAFADYQQTRFGGWPFSSDAPVHGREQGRFARYADGTVNEPG